MASSTLSKSTLHKRPLVVNATFSSSTPSPSGGRPLIPDIDPPPKPPRVLPFLAFCLILFLACLQFFLPATHFRDPNDRLRNWIPIHYHTQQNTTKITAEVESRMDVYSWVECLDLRVLAVLVNSTLSNSRFPENLYFHFFVPEGEDEKLSYYKLKVLLPHSNLEIIGQKEAKEKLKSAIPEWELLWPSLHDLIPLLIPIYYPSLSRFVYVSSNTIMKGNIEDLFGLNIQHYAIAAAKDCNRKLGDNINIEIVNAIQRTAAKTWVSDEPYDADDCTPDLSLLLVDAQKLDKSFMEVMQWWIKALSLKDERSKMIDAAFTFTLYNRYLELPYSWKICDAMPSGVTNILRYDGPTRVCSDDTRENQGSNTSNIWRQYVNPKLDAILAN